MARDNTTLLNLISRGMHDNRSTHGISQTVCQVCKNCVPDKVTNTIEVTPVKTIKIVSLYQTMSVTDR